MEGPEEAGQFPVTVPRASSSQYHTLQFVGARGSAPAIWFSSSSSGFFSGICQFERRKDRKAMLQRAFASPCLLLAPGSVTGRSALVLMGRGGGRGVGRGHPGPGRWRKKAWPGKHL